MESQLSAKVSKSLVGMASRFLHERVQVYLKIKPKGKSSNIVSEILSQREEKKSPEKETTK